MFTRKLLAGQVKRHLALLLTALMVAGMLPLSALAAGGYTSADQIAAAGGTTTPNSKVTMTKTVATTATEGKFEVTLSVTTKDAVEQTSVAVAETVDVVLVVDASGSMGSGSSSKMAKAKSAAISFVDSFLASNSDGKRQVAVVPYSDDVDGAYYGYLGLSGVQATVETAIGKIESGGGTNIQAGLKKAGELLSASTAAHKIVILLSDGKPTYYYGGNEAGRTAADPKEFISVGSGGSAYTQDWLYTGFKTSRQGNGQDTSKTHAYSTVAQARLLQKSGVEIYGIGIGIGSDDAAKYTMYNSVTLTGYGTTLSKDSHYFDYSGASGGDLATALNQYFEVIERNITIKTHAWKVAETLGDKVSFAGFVDGAKNNAANSGSAMTWDLKAPGTTYTGNAASGYTYTTKYYITLKTTDGTFANNTAYPVHTASTLTYSFEDDVYAADTGDHVKGEMKQYTSNFSLPQVKGFLADLKFTKVAAENASKTLAGAAFSLTGSTTVGGSVSRNPVSGAEGKVTVTKLPAGSYTLTETAAPGGYDVVAALPVIVAFGKVSLGGTELGDNYNYKLADTLQQVYTDLPVTKTWLSEDSMKQSVKITLLVDGTSYDTITLTAAGNWQGTFTHVPTINTATGADAVYSFTETDLNDNQLTSFDFREALINSVF